LFQFETDKAIALLGEAESLGGADLDCQLNSRLQVLKAESEHQRLACTIARGRYEEAIRFSRQYHETQCEAEAWVGLGSINWHERAFVEAESSWKTARALAVTLAPLYQQFVELGIDACRDDQRRTPF
jgi:hypothetical protein